jgi:hypothetical protein
VTRLSVSDALVDLLRQLFRFGEMLLNDRQRLLGKLLQGSVVASFGVSFKQIFRILVASNLLLSIGLIEVRIRRAIKVVRRSRQSPGHVCSRNF